MMPERRYTTCFGAIIDAEIGQAIKAGMPLENITAELGLRWGECFDTVVARARLRQSQEENHALPR